MVNAGGIRLFDFPADDFHRAVHHAVLFGERFGQDGKCRRQPAVGEHRCQFAAFSEPVDLFPDDADRFFFSFLRMEVELLVCQMSFQMVLFGTRSATV